MRPAVCLLLVALCWSVANPADAAAPPLPGKGVMTVKNVVYYQGQDHDRIKHRLDLYLPTGLQNFPVLFFVHGGAWVHGDKDFLGIYSLLANTYARAGIGVVVTNYRLSPAVKHPEHVKDVARAIAWTCRNIGKYGGRADRLFLCGHSAGGHLVSLVTANPIYLAAEGLTVQAITGVIPISGVYSIPAGLLARVFGSDRQAHEQASPIAHVRAKLPPFLILYADKDLPTCGRSPSEAFCRALKAKDVSAETLEIGGSDHFRIILNTALAKTTESSAIMEFIRRHTER